MDKQVERSRITPEERLMFRYFPRGRDIVHFAKLKISWDMIIDYYQQFEAYYITENTLPLHYKV